MIRPEAVLFDCDGVLVDSEPAANALLAEEMAAHGHPMSEQDVDTHFLGLTMDGVATKARKMGIPLAPDWVNGFYERLYDKLAEGTALIPGVEAFLDKLDAAGIRYAVGSNGSRRKMGITLGQNPGVWTRVEGLLFSGQEVDAPKPAPDLYLTAARALGVSPANCVVIEDSPSGARAGINAGMRVIGFAPDGSDRLADVGALVLPDYDAIAEELGV